MEGGEGRERGWIQDLKIGGGGVHQKVGEKIFSATLTLGTLDISWDHDTYHHN